MSTKKVVWALGTNFLWAISLWCIYHLLASIIMPLENVLAISYFLAAVIQSVCILAVIKVLRLY